MSDAGSPRGSVMARIRSLEGSKGGEPASPEPSKLAPPEPETSQAPPPSEAPLPKPSREANPAQHGAAAPPPEPETSQAPPPSEAPLPKPSREASPAQHGAAPPVPAFPVVPVVPAEQLITARLLQSEKAAASATARAAERVLLAMRRELEAEEGALCTVQSEVVATRTLLEEARERRAAAEEERKKVQTELSSVIQSHERLQKEMDAARRGGEESVKRRAAMREAVERAREERAESEREEARLRRVLAVVREDALVGETLRSYLRSLMADVQTVHETGQLSASAVGQTEASAVECFDIDSVHHPAYRKHLLQEQRLSMPLLERALAHSPQGQQLRARHSAAAPAKTGGEDGWVPKRLPTGRMPQGLRQPRRRVPPGKAMSADLD